MTYSASNREALGRLRSLLSKLDDDALGRRLENGWTVAATLAHIAFWDGWNVERWAYFQEHGELPEAPEFVTDFVNAAAAGQWDLIPDGRVPEHVLASAERVVACIDGLSEEAVAEATRSGRTFMVDRREHWYPHLDEIEKAISG